jgi:hypothetical protein
MEPPVAFSLVVTSRVDFGIGFLKLAQNFALAAGNRLLL